MGALLNGSKEPKAASETMNNRYTRIFERMLAVKWEKS